MEPGKIISGIAVLLIGVIAVANLLNFYNEKYGTSAGSSFNTTLNTVSGFTANFSGMSNEISGNVIPESGSSATDQQASLLSKSWRTITKLGDLLGLVPDIIEKGADVLRIPDEYTYLAKWLFNIILGLTIAYIIFIGAERLLT